jgi:hypothetical protein
MYSDFSAMSVYANVRLVRLCGRRALPSFPVLSFGPRKGWQWALYSKEPSGALKSIECVHSWLEWKQCASDDPARTRDQQNGPAAHR